jgi:glycosyltransferase involved in cell wall biosynthesis
VIVTSKSYYDYIEFPNKHLVPWGIDHEQYSGTRTPHEGYKLLFVGQMRPYKGLKTLLRAMKGIEAELQIVGEGPERAKYEAYAKKMILNNVHFRGTLSDTDLKKEYLENDVLILPSVRMNEAFGLVTLEAASAGCAVIASDLPGLRDVVRDFGVLVKPNDDKGLREAIIKLEDYSIRKKHVEKGKKAVLKYNWKKVAREYLKIYEKILNSK